MNYNKTTKHADGSCVPERDQSHVPDHPSKSLSPTKTRLFHYTHGTNAVKIFKSGAIRQATGGLQKRERPVVWFSSHPLYEPTALPAWEQRGQARRLTSIKELANYEVPFRFEVDPDEFPLTWLAFINLSGCPRKESRRLARIAKAWGANIAGWRISFEPVPVHRCLGVKHGSASGIPSRRASSARNYNGGSGSRSVPNWEQGCLRN